MRNTLVCIKGAGDIGSAVAHRLFNEGYTVVMIESSAPLTPRRYMSFAQAVFDGEAELENVRAVRVIDINALKPIIEQHEALPILVNENVDVIQALQAEILIDARMRKKLVPEVQIHQAPLTIGLGPNFRAGQTTHIVIETNWGDTLGKVIYKGESEPYTGRPREVAGFAGERYTYAPCDGIWHATLDIGERINKGDILGSVSSVVVRAEISGIVRGITQDGLAISAGTKIVDIDPRADGLVKGMGERPRQIADGVLRAIREWETQRTNHVMREASSAC